MGTAGPYDDCHGSCESFKPPAHSWPANKATTGPPCKQDSFLRLTTYKRFGQLWISRKGRAPSSLSTSSRCRVLWCCQNCSILSCQHTNTNGDVGHPRRAYMLSKTICMRPLGDSAPLSTYLMRRFSPHEVTLEAPSSTKVSGDCPTAALVLTFRLSTPSRRVHPSTRRSSTRRHLGQCASRLDFPVY
ncbi:hypothetical protein IG631_06999 [Alternaria alternata]|nr:hypothetical protein IG631_06999 [Alternaria alternata]